MGHFSLISRIDPGPHAAERACVQALEQDGDALHTRIASSSHLTDETAMGYHAEGCQAAALARSELHARMSSENDLIVHQLRVAIAHARQVHSDKSTLCNMCDVHVRTRTGKALLLLTNFLQTINRELVITGQQKTSNIAWQPVCTTRV